MAKESVLNSEPKELGPQLTEGTSATQWCADSTRLGAMSEPLQIARPCVVLNMIATTFES